MKIPDDKRELPIVITGKLPWMGFCFCLGAYLFLRGNFGRYLMGVSVTIWIVVAGLLAVAIDNTIVRFFVGQMEYGALTAKFALAVIALVLFNLLEIFCRRWEDDPILSASPGQSRTWAYDWLLPKQLGGQEAAARIVEPAICLAVSVFLAPHDPFLGGYFFLTSIISALLGNYLYIDERHAIKNLQDMKLVGQHRMDYVTGGDSSDEITPAGLMESAVPRGIEEAGVVATETPAEFAAIDLPRSYGRDFNQNDLFRTKENSNEVNEMTQNEMKQAREVGKQLHQAGLQQDKRNEVESPAVAKFAAEKDAQEMEVEQQVEAERE